MANKTAEEIAREVCDAEGKTWGEKWENGGKIIKSDRIEWAIEKHAQYLEKIMRGKITGVRFSDWLNTHSEDL